MLSVKDSCFSTVRASFYCILEAVFWKVRPRLGENILLCLDLIFFLKVFRGKRRIYLHSIYFISYDFGSGSINDFSFFI